jgi:predicted DNA-binding protein
MAKPRTIRLPDEMYSFLEIEAEKQSVPLSEVVRRIIDDVIKGNPILTSIVDLDKQIKEKTLAEKIEKIRERKYRNDYVEQNGFYPPRGALHVKVIEKSAQQQSAKTVWTGSKYGQTTSYQTTTEPKITDISEKDWQLIFPAMTEFDKDKQQYRCIIPNCIHGCQREGTARQHIIDNHEAILQENLRQIKSW